MHRCRACYSPINGILGLAGSVLAAQQVMHLHLACHHDELDAFGGLPCKDIRAHAVTFDALQVLEPDAVIMASIAEANAFAATGQPISAEAPEMVQLGQQAKQIAEVSESQPATS